MLRAFLLLLFITVASLCSGQVAQAQPQPRYWIFLDDSASVRSLEAAGIEIRTYSQWLRAASAELTPEQAAQTRSWPFVRNIRPVARFVRAESQAPFASVAPLVAASPADYGDSFTQLAMMNAIAPLEAGYNGRGVRVGFIDTAFRFDHPALRHIPEDDRLIATFDWVHDREDVSEGSGHGTLVASAAVGYAPGFLIGPGYGAEVLAAQTENTASETHQEEDDLVAALEWMADHDVDVVNISLGYRDFPDDPGNDYTYEDFDGDTAVTTRAVDEAAKRGIVVVTSMGNTGGCGAPDAGCFFYLTSPADADSAIAVGAVKKDSVLATFSSRGPTADGRTRPDVVAMGQSVRVAVAGGTFGSVSGTSVAAPLVTGVVAQMLQANPSLTPLQVRDILRETASRSGNPDNAYGWGVVNAEAAVNRAFATPAPDPSPLPFSFSPPAPHPARTQTTFVFTATSQAPATLTLFDVLGRNVAVPFAGVTRAGTNVVHVDVRNLSPGLYVYRFLSADGTHTGRLLVIR